MEKIVKWLPLILSVSLVTPLANDIFTPSLPAIAEVFNTDRTQLLLSAFMCGLALAQLFYGPLSDRFGRKPVLLLGLSIFILASVVAAVAQSFTMLLAARFGQAIGACCTIPCAMAILRDIYPPEKLLKAVSYLMGSIVVAPVLAPLLGSYFQAYFGWRASFIFLLALGIFYWLIAKFVFKETLEHKNLDALNIGYIVKTYGKLLKHRNYVGFMLTMAFTYGGIFCYVAVAPFLLIKQMQVPVEQFGWYFLLFAVMITIMTFVVPHLGKKVELHYLTISGMALFMLGTLLLLLLNVYFTPSPWLIVGPMMLAGIGVGIVRPAAATSIMKIIPRKIAGISASLMNTALFSFGMITTGMMSFIPNTPLVFATVMLVLGTAGTLSCFLTLKLRDPITL